jgi:hypothetical protein
VNIFPKFTVETKICYIELYSGLEILENMEDEDNIDNINKKWENIKTISKETKQQLKQEN